MVIFPLAPDQTIAQMWSNGARGRKTVSENVHSSITRILSSHAIEGIEYYCIVQQKFRQFILRNVA